MTVADLTRQDALAAPSSDFTRFTALAAITIALVFGAFGNFAVQAPLDSAAIAPGRVAAETSTKPLQHLEGGIVREILVTESQKVKEGDVLFRLESTQAKASAELLNKQLDADRAQEVRLLAERDGASTIIFPSDLLARKSLPETAAAIADQERQFKERRGALEAQTKILRGHFDQATRELTSAKAQETSIQDQISNLKEEIEGITSLLKKGLYPKSKLMASQRDLMRLEQQLNVAQGDIARLNGTANEAKLQIAQVEQKVREEAAQQLTDVRARMSESSSRKTVADDTVNRVEIRAPQSGVVQGLKVTPGAVVRPGESLADLVPSGDKLVLAVRVSPLDIDSVEAGQKAEVRFPGFASRGFPIIMGRVERVSADAMLDETTKEPYYLARVEADPATLPVEVSKRLQPGMPADVLIVTGERTLFQYLVGPLSNVMSKSLREQ